MTEKNILAYFHTPEQAEGAANKLRALRAVDVQVERFSRYPGEGVEQVMNPLTGDFASLGNLTLDASFSSSAGILAAADVSASGMSDGGQGGPTGRDVLLAAVVDESVHHQALRVVEEAGGMV